MGMHALEARSAPLEKPATREFANPEDAPAEVDLQFAVAVFVEQRSRLFKIAYRILGSTNEAEDVVQEVWLRWQRTDRRVVINPPAFLATATSRVAINVLQAARTRHESAVTPWQEDLAGPRGDAGGDPETTAERTEAVEFAIRVLLERLNPAERAAYVLRTGFDYPYSEIAAVLHISAPNARQVVSRAHGHLKSAPRRPVSDEAHRHLVRAFVAAAKSGEFADLETLLAGSTCDRCGTPQRTSRLLDSESPYGAAPMSAPKPQAPTRGSHRGDSRRQARHWVQPATRTPQPRS